MIAIYARQSVDKKDSISIETQIEDCKKKISSSNTEPIEIFTDKGISGKSTVNRPEFQRMMVEVRKKNVSKIIVYKVDRISRSLLDFANMREEFAEHDVKFISCIENFDTTTEIGNAMLSIVMVFAEMERKVIQKRITDNYYARGKKGFYLGGYAPFGYGKIATSVDGKKTYMFAENENESVILKQIFGDYISGKSIGAIARELNNKAVKSRKGKPWANASLARILRSPVYVKANADVYNYLAGLGATMNNTIDEYIGKNGCVVYGNAKERSKIKFADLSTDFVTLGLHEGIIDASVWLGVQYTINQKQGHSNLGTGSLSWLQGLVKCQCGYTYYVKPCKSGKKQRELKYFYCRGRRINSCSFPRDMVRVDKVERIVEEAIISRLYELKNIQANKIEASNPELNSLKIQVAKKDEDISKLVKAIIDDSNITADYLNKEIEKLHREKQALINKTNDIQLKANRNSEIDINVDVIINNWFIYDIDTKKAIAKKIIQKITLKGDDLEIDYY